MTLRRLLPAVAALLLPPAALAAGGGGDAGDMIVVVSLLLGIGAAYVFAHFVVEWFQRRFLIVTGLEYLVLGFLLGPGANRIGAFDDLTPLAPIIALAAGWVGLVYGMKLDVRQLFASSDQAGRLALLDSLCSGLLVAVTAHWFFRSGAVGDIPNDGAWLAAGAMGCASAAGSNSAIELLSRRYDQTDGLLSLLGRASTFGNLAAILAFGLLFSLFHAGSSTALSLTPADWAWVTVILGLTLGALFTVFLGADESDNSRFLTFVGIITFASGAAFFLNLSLLTVNLLLGVVLATSQQDRGGAAQTLARTTRPMTLVLLVFAGALWVPPTTWPDAGITLFVACGYMFLRIVGKLVGCWVASFGTEMRGDLSRGLLAQGDVAIAMAVSFRLVYEGPAIDLAYSAILLSVVVHELVAPRLLKGLLVDTGEIRREVPVAGGG